MEAFYKPLDDGRYEPTEHTEGPWTDQAQHGGPPSALLGRAIERLGQNSSFHIARITVEILRPVPIEPLTVTAEIVRPGRSVELVEATLSTDRMDVMKARAWRIRETGPHELGAAAEAAPPPPGPEEGDDVPKFNDTGYLRAMETRFVAGAFRERGPATAWFRMRYPLVAGEEPSPLTRVLAAADSGSGVSASIDWDRFLFVNPDLTVYLHRYPRSEWICLDAATTPGPNGVGLAVSTISDQDGAIGHGIQSLFIAPHS